MTATYFRILLRETVVEVLSVPVWWYTRGAVRALERCRIRIHDANEYVGFKVWLKNMFVPMYGQYDTVGRLISIGIRLIQVVVRGLALLLVTFVSVLLLFAYFLLPIFAFAEFLVQWIPQH